MQVGITPGKKGPNYLFSAKPLFEEVEVRSQRINDDYLLETSKYGSVDFILEFLQFADIRLMRTRSVEICE